MFVSIPLINEHLQLKFPGCAPRASRVFSALIMPIRRLVQELERVLSSRFTIVEIEHTTKPFAAMRFPAEMAESSGMQGGFAGHF